MTKSDAEETARLFQQLHKAYAFLGAALLRDNDNVTIGELRRRTNTERGMGMALLAYVSIAFIYSYDGVFKKIPRSSTILDQVDLARLAPSRNNQKMEQGVAVETSEEAALRHLRNCFAHRRFNITTDGQSRIDIDLKDTQGNQLTFQANCDLIVLSEIAERVLIAAHKDAAALALSPQP